MIALLLAMQLGAFDPAATAADVCSSGYSRHHRRVTRTMRERVYDRDGIAPDARGGYVVDHVVPVSLAGRSTLQNLAAQPREEAARKDRDEDTAHAHVCDGEWTLQHAREWLLSRWSR